MIKRIISWKKTLVVVALTCVIVFALLGCDNNSSYIIIRGYEINTSETELHLPFSYLTNEDIIPLQYMTNLRMLDLGFNQISDLTPLSDLTSLTGLVLDGNQIRDLVPLVGLYNLEALMLSANHISDLRPLSGLTNLRGLALGGNQISDLRPLSGLINLEVLLLDGNPITDWSPVEHILNRLNYGDSSSNYSYITIGGLEISTSATELDLLDMNLTNEDIVVLRHMTNLEWLSLPLNQISDLSPLSGLANLARMCLSGNFVTDWSPVDHVEYVRSRP